MRATFAFRDQSTSASTASGVAGTGPRGTYASRTGPRPRNWTLAIAPLARPSMSHDHNVAVLVARQDGIQLSVDRGLDGFFALSAWDDVPPRLFRPQHPGLWEPLLDLGDVETFPPTQVNLAQARGGDRR